MTPAEAATRIRETFDIEPSSDGATVTAAVPVDRWQDLGRFARRELGCVYFSWLSAVDWKAEGLDVVCRVENLANHLVVMMRTRLGPGVSRCPTLTGIWRGADWMERECYDMFGIAFETHPDLRRILLPQDWQGHPLLKEYAVDTPHPPYR